jgi:hypothetical protein
VVGLPGFATEEGLLAHGLSAPGGPGCRAADVPRNFEQGHALKGMSRVRGTASLIAGVFFVVGAAIVLSNLIADLVHYFLEPRVRLSAVT